MAAPTRRYDNSHRAGQAAETREAILDGLVRVMARGVAELSIPAVAREAGVSLRTVYRNFPSKRDLLDALNSHLDARIGYTLEPLPNSPEELIAHVRRYFRALDNMDATLRAARASQIAQEARADHAGGVDLKRAGMASALASIDRTLPADTRARLFNVIATLFSQHTLQRMKDDLGLTAAQAAESVVWAIEACLAAADRSKPGKPEHARATKRR